MRIERFEKLEDCFDGSAVFAVHFDAPWGREDILRLETLGELDFFPDFPRPFFRLRGAHGMQAKGVEGERSCRLILPRRERDAIRQSFESLFANEPRRESRASVAR